MKFGTPGAWLYLKIDEDGNVIEVHDDYRCHKVPVELHNKPEWRFVRPSQRPEGDWKCDGCYMANRKRHVEGAIPDPDENPPGFY